MFRVTLKHSASSSERRSLLTRQQPPVVPVCCLLVHRGPWPPRCVHTLWGIRAPLRCLRHASQSLSMTTPDCAFSPLFRFLSGCRLRVWLLRPVGQGPGPQRRSVCHHSLRVPPGHGTRDAWQTGWASAPNRPVSAHHVRGGGCQGPSHTAQTTCSLPSFTSLLLPFLAPQPTAPFPFSLTSLYTSVHTRSPQETPRGARTVWWAQAFDMW